MKPKTLQRNDAWYVMQVAEDISREVGKRADAVRRIRQAVFDSLADRDKNVRHECCEDNYKFTVDQRFPGKVTSPAKRTATV